MLFIFFFVCASFGSILLSVTFGVEIEKIYIDNPPIFNISPPYRIIGAICNI